MDELMEQLHAMIPPEGKYRRFQLHNNFADTNFLKECVADTEHLMIRLALGEKPNTLERLGLEILFNTAGEGWREWLKND